jgi:alpha-tubulin suppressor-like RCC1 family protein
MKDLIDALCSNECAGRKTASPGGRRAKGLIVDALRGFGLDPAEQPVPVSGGINVLATVPGDIDRWVLVAAHYDHLGVSPGGAIYRGADDNAAAVAMLVELARSLTQKRPTGRGVMLAFFDAEEPPWFTCEGMGSQHFVRAPTVPLDRIDLMVCLELMGHALGVAGLPASRHVTTYHHHTCAIGRDDMIRCWGQNYWGEAGGGTEAQVTPIAVRGITNATDLQGGYQTGSGSEAQYHKCALLSGGTVQCWGSGAGSNDYGQLGDGTTTARSVPAAVTGLSDATQIAVEGYHNCALRRGGTVVCWGNNTYGQLGDGTTMLRSTPVAVTGLANVVEVQVGRSHSCARHTNGTVSCWGRNFHGELGDGTMVDRGMARVVPGITTAASLHTGHNHTCVRLADNTVRCWGRNIEGQLADGSNTNRFSPTQPTYLNTATPPAPVTLTGVTALRCAVNVCYARLMDGTARTWGNSTLRVANDSNRVIDTPQWVAQGFGVTCQYRTDNNVWCTGTNEFGQVGVGRRSSSEPYTMVTGTFSRIQSGYLPGVPCAIERTTGRVLCWGPTRYEYMNSAGTPALDGYTRAPAVVALP